MALFQAFEAEDVTNSGKLSKAVWAAIMARVTDVRIRWLVVLAGISDADVVEHGFVHYCKFLKCYSGKAETVKTLTLDTLYAQRHKLEALFHVFDVDGDGSISLPEFVKGLSYYRRIRPPHTTSITISDDCALGQI